MEFLLTKIKENLEQKYLSLYKLIDTEGVILRKIITLKILKTHMSTFHICKIMISSSTQEKNGI